MVAKCCRWRVADGWDIYSLNDKWTKQPFAHALEDDNVVSNPNFLVGEFIDYGSMTWNVDKLYDYFDMDSVDTIM